MKKPNKPNKAEIIKSDQEAHCNTFKNTVTLKGFSHQHKWAILVRKRRC